MPDFERLKQKLFKQGYRETDLAKKPLTYAGWTSMSPDLQEWHCVYNPDAVDAALNSQAAEKFQAEENERNAEAYDARRFHENKYSPDETEQAISEIQKFCAAYPQFIGASMANRETLLAKLKAMNALPVFSSIVAAYEACVLEGSISVNPSALGLGHETDVSGFELRNYRQIDKVLMPAAKVLRQKTTSADQYKAEHPELFRDENAEVAFVSKHFERVRNEFKSLRPQYADTAANARILKTWIEKHGTRFDITNLLQAFDACKDQLEMTDTVVSSGGHTVIDYGAPRNTPPALPEKQSLRNKVKNQSADDYLSFINNDSSAREAIDASR
jgi:hypothetical protein